MYSSYEWAEWHLTPRGWEQGSYRTDFKRETLPEPEDRVKTVTYTESSGRGHKESHRVDWEGDPGQIAELEAKFGGPPSHV